MIEEAKNKAMGGAEDKADRPTIVRAVSALTQEYFFPGGGKWRPMSVVAATREDAESIHRARREPIEAEEKVEDKQTDNQ